MWDSFLEMAMEYLQRRQERLIADFQLGSWKRYGYDQEAGALFMVLQNVRRPQDGPAR